MRTYILLVILFIFTSCEQEQPKTQKIEAPATDSFSEDTVAVKQKASKACADGKFKLYFTGMQDNASHFYGEYLEKEKGIEIEFSGCTVLAEYEITNRIMEECIKSKYGQDFFEKTQKEAYKRYVEEQK